MLLTYFGFKKARMENPRFSSFLALTFMCKAVYFIIHTIFILFVYCIHINADIPNIGCFYLYNKFIFLFIKMYIHRGRLLYTLYLNGQECSIIFYELHMCPYRKRPAVGRGSCWRRSGASMQTDCTRRTSKGMRRLACLWIRMLGTYGFLSGMHLHKDFSFEFWILSRFLSLF